MLDLSILDWVADAAPGDIVLFRFRVAAGSGIVKRGLCLVVDRRRAGVGVLRVADLGIQRSKWVQLR